MKSIRRHEESRMNHGTERNRKRWEAMTPEQRAAVERIREAHRSPADREQEERARTLVRSEFPPAVPDPELLNALAALRLERERQGLSLTDLSERTGLDRATISKLETGKVANPTVATLRTYATALGKRLEWSLVDTTSA
jgi:ribosome-binding protein aMBF1 (putative translation factor)